MFTGLVETAGTVTAITDQAGGAGGKRLTLDVGDWKPRNGVFAVGDSICVSGVCLTVIECSDGSIAFDVITETLDRSRLGALTVGSKVNLESSLTAGTAMGGHFVQGHVDATGEVMAVQQGEDWRITIATPEHLKPYIVPKGSVCIDGVSLTLAAVHADCFEVALIPTTLDLTTLSDLQAGDPVNLEADVIVKSIVHNMQNMGLAGGDAGEAKEKQGVTMQTLRDAGFVTADNTVPGS